MFFLLSLAQVGCTHPCETLEVKVCDEQEDEKRCDLIQDPERREALTRKTCEGILEKMEARR